MATKAQYHIDINPAHGWYSSAGATPGTFGSASIIGGGYVRQVSGPATNDAISWRLILPTGTWTMTTIMLTDPSGGQIQWSLGGSNVGSAFEAYSASIAYNVVTQYTGISVASEGPKTLTATVTGKNASSLSYNYYIEHIALRKTA